MTRLSGEFDTDLPLPEALAACAEAIHGLGWPITAVEGQRIVCHAGPMGEDPPRIEVALTEAAEGTTIRIIGSDSETNPLDEDALIAELDRARDSIQASIGSATEASSSGSAEGVDAEEKPGTEEDAAEPQQTEAAEKPGTEEDAGEPQQTEAAEAQRPAPGWYPDAYNRDRLQYWDGERWTQQYRSAEVPSQAGTPPQSQIRETQPQIPERRFRSLHVIANIYGVLGWLVAILGSIAVIAAAVGANNDSSSDDPGTILVVGLVAVAFYALLLFGISAAIRLALAVEENTRTTVEVLRARRETP